MRRVKLWLARLWQEAGLPDGVFNVLQGDKVAVDGLLTHPDVKAVSFVGSTPIARYVYESGTLIPGTERGMFTGVNGHDLDVRLDQFNLDGTPAATGYDPFAWGPVPGNPAAPGTTAVPEGSRRLPLARILCGAHRVSRGRSDDYPSLPRFVAFAADLSPAERIGRGASVPLTDRGPLPGHSRSPGHGAPRLKIPDRSLTPPAGSSLGPIRCRRSDGVP